MENTQLRNCYLLDFDGTVTTTDTLCYLLDQYGDAGWRALDEQVEHKKVPLVEAFHWQMNTLQVDVETAIQDVLQVIQLRAGIHEFIAWCAQAGHLVKIVSGGFHELIEPILRHHGIEVEVIANRIGGRTPGGGWSVVGGERLSECEVSLCKCIPAIQAKSVCNEVIFLGDGITDYCVAQKCDRVYGVRGEALERMFFREQRVLFSFSDFHEVLYSELQFTHHDNLRN